MLERKETEVEFTKSKGESLCMGFIHLFVFFEPVSFEYSLTTLICGLKKPETTKFQRRIKSFYKFVFKFSRFFTQRIFFPSNKK